MSKNERIHEVIEQAKQQRAEFIGSALQTHALPVALVAALSLVLLQFVAEPTTETAQGAEIAQVMSIGN